MSLIRTFVVACIGLGFVTSGSTAQAGIMEGIVNQVFAQMEHDVKTAFTRPKTTRPQAGTATPTPPTQSRRPGYRCILRR